MSDPTIDLSDPTAYVVQLWVCGNKNLDWMQCLYRPKNGEPLRIVGRIRLHVDDKAFDSDDVKAPFEVRPLNGVSQAEFEASAQRAATDFAEKLSVQLITTRVEGGIEAFLEAIKRPPLDRWFHRKEIRGEPGETTESLLERTKRRRQR